MTGAARTWRRGAPTTVVALVAAIAGAFTLRLAFPAPSMWVLAPVGVALTLWALRGRSARGGALVGFVGGLAFWLPLIDWIRFFLGEAGAGDVGLVLLVALASFMSLWGALGSALIAVVLRRSPTDLRWRLGVVPPVVAGLWTAREGLSATVPWGGFSWGRVGFSQAGGPIDGLFSWVGAAGVSFLVVALAALAVETVAAGPPPASARGWSLVARGGTPVTVLALLLVLVPAWAVPARGSITVAGIQGDTKSSYADPPKVPGDVLRTQVRETLAIEGRRVDLVVWPEGGSDRDPIRDPGAARLWDEVVRRIGAPLLGWSVTQTGERYFNSSLLWTADGVAAQYDKRHPVPFGEYVPARPVFHAIVPGLVDLLQRDYTPGSRDSTIPVGDGVRAGVFICFDIADDALTRAAVAQGAQFLISPSNNTDFGRYSDESVQQLQIARVRALESGRTVIGVSTVATSAVIAPDGTVTDRLPTWTPGAIVARIPLAEGTTPAMVLGAWLEPLLGALGLAGWIVALVAGRRRGPT